MNLHALQDAFQAYVLHGAGQVRERVAPGRLANAERRLRIYHDAYRLRLIEALASDYETLRAALGEEAFRTAALAYVEANVSQWRNVRWYGARLPDFLRGTAPWSDRVWLSDVARFEWTLTLAFDAADAPSATFAELAALPPEAWAALAFRLHPSVHLLRLSSNAPALRKAVDAGAALPAIETHDPPVDWLIWRDGLGVSFRSLAAAEHCALAAVQRGESFPAICEGICAFVRADEAPALTAGWLRAWVDDGLIAAAVLP
ncbi:MAG TPA: DNA-binding domain-containing protein [Burkholderiales bacterium]|nr:DNA-binding domain-containing protein [Burkholderiales bacterium]